jgi:hypothetical protein
MTTPTTPTTTPSSIWFTDGSRYKTGTANCPRRRWLNYHSGPTGYGITAKRDSLPLATGISTHQGVEEFAYLLARYDRLPDVHETRLIINEVCDIYVHRVELRGFRGILGSAETEETIAEQRTLIAGLLWAVRLKFLPWLHENYQIVQAEEERLHFLSCTCGAPPLDQAEHDRRGCTGQALQIRSDLIGRRRGGQNLAYFEFKTTSWAGDAWSEQWETTPQLALGTLDAERLWGGEVTELYVVRLDKGARRRDKYDADQRRRQLSPLCYGYCRPGNPPLAPDDWLPSYEWINDNGEVKRKTKAHERRGVWTLGDSDWPVKLAYMTTDPDLTPEEFWVRFLPHSILDKVCAIIGPLNRQDQQLQSLLRSFAGEELRWQQVLWELYELQTQGYNFASDLFQSTLDRLVPCSWNCRPFGRDHECEFVPICHRHSGWDDPFGSGHYQPRLPHHQPELDQAIARGLLPAEAAEAIEEE